MGIFNRSARGLVGVNSFYPYTFICLTTSFTGLRSESLIGDEILNEFLDSLLSFWDFALERKDITEYEYSSYFLMTAYSPKETYIYDYSLADDEVPIWESLVLELVKEFQKYRSVDLRRSTADFGLNIPNDVIRVIESKGFACPVGSSNFAMAYAVTQTFVYIITRTESEPRMDRLGKRLLASEILPVFLSFWYFRKKL